ncbi:MAG: Uma2 family endonuclease [Xenococcaceae cyanobacterium MO_188.B29]|nr:Uma2 family endonuclease [Xenococcaceae cyanobacterium MO_188.B29]
MTLTTYKWSIEQWHKLVESGLLEGKPVELLEGEIIEMSPEGVEHSYTNRYIVKYLRELLTEEAEIIQAQPITLDNSEPEPDVTIARLPEAIYRTHHPYAQDIYWLIEISNRTLTINLKQKSRLYARNNIPEYWVIDLVGKKLIVHTQPENKEYSQIVEYKTGVIIPQAFPKIAIELDKLLLF